VFTHPALLREMTLLADFLRRSGEHDWSRKVVAAADRIRKSGWTEAGAGHVDGLFRGEPNLYQVTFGAEHARWLSSPADLAKAQARLEQLRLKVQDLATQPLVAAESGARPRSPDLPPLAEKGR
jgi:hypothetical protein